jgi:hypothetical protein
MKGVRVPEVAAREAERVSGVLLRGGAEKVGKGGLGGDGGGFEGEDHPRGVREHVQGSSHEYSPLEGGYSLDEERCEGVGLSETGFFSFFPSHLCFFSSFSSKVFLFVKKKSTSPTSHRPLSLDLGRGRPPSALRLSRPPPPMHLCPRLPRRLEGGGPGVCSRSRLQRPASSGEEAASGAVERQQSVFLPSPRTAATTPPPSSSIFPHCSGPVLYTNAHHGQCHFKCFYLFCLLELIFVGKKQERRGRGRWPKGTRGRNRISRPCLLSCSRRRSLSGDDRSRPRLRLASCKGRVRAGLVKV